MSIERKQHTESILTDGNVLVIGGYSNTNALNSTELYNVLSTD